MRKPADPMVKKEKLVNNNNKAKLRKGLWSPEEDEKLMSYMLSNGQGCWSDIARNAGLLRCGKSCRLRWINYLRPDLKRGAFSPQEEQLILHLHSILGNRFLSLSLSLLFISFFWHLDILASFKYFLLPCFWPNHALSETEVQKEKHSK